MLKLLFSRCLYSIRRSRELSIFNFSDLKEYKLETSPIFGSITVNYEQYSETRRLSQYTKHIYFSIVCFDGT